MKHPLFSLLVACTLGAALLSSARAADKEVAVLKTSEGEMVVEFWPDVAPGTVANFVKLAKAGFYDGTAFHRILDGFMIQGGDPNTKDPGKEESYGMGGSGERIKLEKSDRKHELGVISMARAQEEDSASSQFFICLAPANDEHMQSLNGRYATFGKVIKGLDVLKALGKTPVGPKGRERSKPLSRVALVSVKIVPADSVK